VRALQRRLRGLGLRPGPVDGLYGPLTEAAVERLQRDNRLAVDGKVGVQTRRVQTRRVLNTEATPLVTGMRYGHPGGALQVGVVQRRLGALDLRLTAADGRYGRTSDPVVGHESRQRGRRPASWVDASAAEDRSPPARGSIAEQGLDEDDTQTTEAPDDQIAATGGPGSTASLPLAVLVVALVATVALSAASYKGRRRSAEASCALDNPVRTGRWPLGRMRAVKLRVGRTAPASPQLGTRRNAAAALSNESAPGSEDGLGRRNQAAAVDAGCREDGVVWNRVLWDVEPANNTGPRDIRAVGYTTEPKGESPNGAAVRERAAAIDAFCEERGWRLLELVRDLENPRVKAPDRPGLTYALERVAREEASCLVVSELKHVSRSASDLGRIVQSIVSNDGRLVAIDVDLDTALPEGRKAANVLISVGASQRERVRERTRNGLEAARAKGRRIGRTGVGDVPELKTRIAAMRASGMTLQAIADQLNEEGTPTLRGGARWRPSSVQAAAGYHRPPRLMQDSGGSTPVERDR
jgi:DNA invertase Pin-like site-specific DNA recombinase/peptidoglycan hydrolase-like protein with peptidoglycan-binding domain